MKKISTFQNKVFQVIFDIKFICKLLAGSSELKDKVNAIKCLTVFRAHVYDIKNELSNKIFQKILMTEI